MYYEKEYTMEMEYFRNMSAIAEIGWLRIDIEKKVCFCSEYLQGIFGWEKECVNLLDFQNRVAGENEGMLLLRELQHLPLGEIYERMVPMLLKEKVVDMKVRFLREEGNHSSVFFGTLQKCEEPQENGKVYSSAAQDMLPQDFISSSLLEFLQSEDLEIVVNSILRNLLSYFHAGRAYIFEYDVERNTQSNTFEVVAENVESEIDNLQQLPLTLNPWWTTQIMSKKNIILDSLGEIPKNAPREEYEVLASQGIKSLMVAPLFSIDTIWGYIGIDVVKNYRKWETKDVQWFSFMANIISICMELRRSKDRVEQERLFLQNLYRYMPLGYICFSRNGMNVPISDYRIVDANVMSGKLLGWSLEESIGKVIKELENDISYDLYSCVERSMRGNDPRENQFFSKTGKSCHGVIYSPEPNVMILLLMDITDNIRIHEELDCSEKLFKDVFANMPVGIEIYDREGNLKDINKKNEEMFGVKKEDVLGVNFFTNPNVPDEAKEKLRQNESVDYSFEYSFEDVGGYYVTRRRDSMELYARSSPLYNNKGELISYIVINIDMTEQNNAIRRIQDFENLFLIISDYAKIGYVKANLWNKKGYAIKQWLKNVGEKEDTPLEDVLGVYSKVYPEDREKLLTFYKDALEGKKTNFRAEIRVVDENDSHKWKWIRTDAVVTQYCPEKQILEVIGVNTDITEQKELEAQLIDAKNRAETMDRLKSAFLANMSHEIRTPLNAIVGFSELLTEMDNLKEQKQYIQIIRSNNDLLLQLISDILDLSKMESGTLDLVKAEMDVNELCEEIVLDTQKKVSEEVEVLFADHLSECSIFSDRDRVSQILANLTNNAVKFTSSGSIRIGYMVKGTDLEFYVEDTGQGISKEKLSAVFDRFVKLDNFVPGTGLGLSVCKALVTQMGGRIGVTSEEGKGSRFWFTLPCKEEMCQAESVVSRELDSELRTERSIPSILVAEDNESNYLLLSAMLKKEYILYHAWNGKEAVEKVKELHPDIILMDIHMPEMDGYEATRRIREFDSIVPIFAVTAFMFEENKEEALKSGCTDFIAKPISVSALKQRIKEVLDL